MVVLIAGLLAGLVIDALVAQVAGERGIAPVAASSDIEVAGIEVQTTGKTAEEAREAGWKEAQRLAWEEIDGPAISDSQLESLVSAIVIEKEQIAPGRYIATLGVIFDRARAGSYLGGVERQSNSAPLLLVPVMMTGGTDTVYEMRNPWQRAWAEYQPGRSPINYVRPVGSGGDSLLVNYGQIGRRSRTWWRGILDQFGAADVIVPIARLEYRWPGGPVDGFFTARYGPDSRVLGSFELSAENPNQVPDMLDQAVRRFDAIFRGALADGKLKPDATLDVGSGEVDPAIARLIEIGRAMRARDAAEAEVPTPQPTTTMTETPQVIMRHIVQFSSPDAQSVDATLGAIRATPGVRGAATTSLALGGTSVMQVSYGGTLEQLADALRARGFRVTQGSSALAISR